jgi:putative endonuclease
MLKPRCSGASTLAIGREAEQAAADFLESHNLAILLRNYRCRGGELDLVATTESGVVVIAEVRLRSHRNYGGGAASVDHHKQRRLIRASRHLLATHPRLARCALRFDVLDLQPAEAGYQINWIKHAFSC